MEYGCGLCLQKLMTPGSPPLKGVCVPAHLFLKDVAISLDPFEKGKVFVKLLSFY